MCDFITVIVFLDNCAVDRMKSVHAYMYWWEKKPSLLKVKSDEMLEYICSAVHKCVSLSQSLISGLPI